MFNSLTTLSAFSGLRIPRNVIKDFLPQLPTVRPVFFEVLNCTVFLPIRICLSALEDYIDYAENQALTLDKESSIAESVQNAVQHKIITDNHQKLITQKLLSTAFCGQTWNRIAMPATVIGNGYLSDLIDDNVWQINKKMIRVYYNNSAKTIILRVGIECFSVSACHSDIQALKQVFADKLLQYTEIPSEVPADSSRKKITIRDLVITHEQWEKLPIDKQQQIESLYNEFTTLGYVDARFHCGPSQHARMTNRQRQDMQSKRLRVFEIESIIKDLLVPDSYREKNIKDQDLRNGLALLNRLKSQIVDCCCAYAKKMQSKRLNAEKRHVADLENQVKEVECDVMSGILPVVLVKELILNYLKSCGRSDYGAFFEEIDRFLVYSKRTSSKNLDRAIKELCNEHRIEYDDFTGFRPTVRLMIH